MSLDIDFYQLNAAPFRLTPDPGFWFESATHRKAMAYLGYGLALGEGFITITGEIGAGKTTLLAHLLQTLDPSRVEALELRPEGLDAAGIWRELGRSLARSSGDDDAIEASDVMAQIELRARMGKRLLITVDEAQRLDDSALDQLRLASNVQQGAQPVVQFLLLGQPELREALERPALAQLAQRVIASHHLEVMEAHEVPAYVLHRLRMAGAQGRPILDPQAAKSLFTHTLGIPRRINQIMSRVLLLAAMREVDTITPDLVDIVVAEQRAEQGLRLVRPESAADADRQGDLTMRLSDLEQRVAGQEAALRRAVHLLVEWAEGRAAVKPTHAPDA